MTGMHNGNPPSAVSLRLGVPMAGWVLKAGWRYVRPPREAVADGAPSICHLVQYLDGLSTLPHAPCGKRFVFSHWSGDNTYATFYDYQTGEDILSFTKLHHRKMVEELCPTCYAKLEQLFRDGLLAPIARRKERPW